MKYHEDCEYCVKAPKVAVYMLTDAKDGWVGAVCCEEHLLMAQADMKAEWPKTTFKTSPWKEWKTHVSLDSRIRLQDFEEGGKRRTLREWYAIYKRRWRGFNKEQRGGESFSHYFKENAERELTVNDQGEDWRLVPRPRKGGTRPK